MYLWGGKSKNTCGGWKSKNISGGEKSKSICKIEIGRRESNLQALD